MLATFPRFTVGDRNRHNTTPMVLLYIRAPQTQGWYCTVCDGTVGKGLLSAQIYQDLHQWRAQLDKSRLGLSSTIRPAAVNNLRSKTSAGIA